MTDDIALHLSGMTLGKQYFLRKVVGHGGMGVVYEAWDQKRGVPVAVKVLKLAQLGLAHDQAGTQVALQVARNFFEMFGQEAATLAKFDHPNIVRLFALNIDEDIKIPYFVMEWIEGRDAQETIDRQGAMSVDETLHIIDPVCAALNFAHQAGMVHCDVKPANIMLSDDGRVFVADFGLAQYRFKEIRGGTPAYMAPEQFQGGTADTSTDVYSLGVTTFQLLTSTLPFDGRHPTSQGQTPRERLEWEHLHEAPPDVRRYTPDVPDSVSAVLQKALSKSKPARYQTAGQFSTAFNQACGGVGGSPGPGRRPRLVRIQGHYERPSFLIDEGATKIGRDPNMKLVIDDSTVSRYQARIVRQGYEVIIENYSEYGTYVNSQSIATHRLRPGDVIEMGSDEVFEYRE